MGLKLFKNQCLYRNTCPFFDKYHVEMMTGFITKIRRLKKCQTQLNSTGYLTAKMKK